MAESGSCVSMAAYHRWAVSWRVAGGGINLSRSAWAAPQSRSTSAPMSKAHAVDLAAEVHLQAQVQGPAGLAVGLPGEVQGRGHVQEEDAAVQVAPIAGLQVGVLDGGAGGALAEHHRAVANRTAAIDAAVELHRLAGLQGIDLFAPLDVADEAQVAVLVHGAAEVPAGASGVAVLVEPGDPVVALQLPGSVPQGPEALADHPGIGVKRKAHPDAGTHLGIPLFGLVAAAQPIQADTQALHAAGAVVHQLAILLGEGALGLLGLALDDQAQALLGGGQVEAEAGAEVMLEGFALLPAPPLGDPQVGVVLDAQGIGGAEEAVDPAGRSEEHTSELQSRPHLVCRLLLEKKKNNNIFVLIL